jgi:UDP-2,3-diacylglucosamine pyrophosphatase LpxH
MGKKVFLSDVHISEGCSLGKDNSYDWLFQENRILLSSFLYNLSIDKTVEEVILLGDIFDTWVMPINEIPSTFEAIINAPCNKAIFETLAQLSKEKPVIYIPGNHDMTAWDETNKKIIQQRINSENFSFAAHYENNRIFAIHGHEYFVFNAADVVPDYKLPLGYYISRFAATLAEQGKPRFNVPWVLVELKNILRKGPSGPHIVEGVIDYLVKRINPIDEHKIDNNYQIPIEPEGYISIEKVIERYINMFSDWHRKTGENWADAVGMQLNADSLNPNKCRELIKGENYKTVVFGHTHEKDNSYVNDESREGYTIGISANCGTWCTKGIKREYPYIEIEMINGNHSIRIGDWAKKYGREHSA